MGGDGVQIEWAGGSDQLEAFLWVSASGAGLGAGGGAGEV